MCLINCLKSPIFCLDAQNRQEVLEMNIEGSSISMQALHNSTKIRTQAERLQFWVGERSVALGAEQAGVRTSRPQDMIQISELARQMAAENEKSKNQTLEVPASRAEELELTLSEKDKQKILLLEKFLEQLKGKKVKLQVPDRAILNEKFLQIPVEDRFVELQQAQNNNRPEGWGLEYDYHETYYESEEMTFMAQGEIHTEDGSVINFALKMQAKREYSEETHLRIRAGDAAKVVDPLTVSLNGAMPELTDTKYRFDLDADGNIDQISFVKPGGGFLALDKNGDGKINSGTELFGPTSGNGFTELAVYDSDQNGWIDANDPVFDQLRMWTKDGQGNDHLLVLGEVGIGAIYLGHIDTPFSLNDQQNDVLGQVSRTGVYVTDNKTVGTIHQVDLVI